MVVSEAGILCWLVNHVRDDTGTFGELNTCAGYIHHPEITGLYTKYLSDVSKERGIYTTQK